MHLTTRYPVCLKLAVGFMATAVCCAPAMTMEAQEFRSPSSHPTNGGLNPANGGTRPQTEPPETEPPITEPAGVEHSILDTTPPSTTSPSVNSIGNEAIGTFAIAPTTPSQSSDTSAHPPSLPPITDNALRTFSTERPLATQPQANSSDSKPFESPVWDEQPSPPMPSEHFHNNGPPMPLTQSSRPSTEIPDSSFNSGPPTNLITSPVQNSDRPFASPIPSSAGLTTNQPAVQPAQFQETIRGANSSKTTNHDPPVDLKLARQIMVRYQVDRASGPLPGRPVTLLEMLNTTPIHQRKQMINQYWKTELDWASLLNSAQFLDWLQKLPDPLDSDELAILRTARASARNQALACEIELGKSQSKLQQFIAQRKLDRLPLPSDRPLVRTYESHYQWYESRGRIPPTLIGFDTLLEKTINLVSFRASTVGTSRVTLSQLRNAYAHNPRSLGSVLEAARLWNQAEHDLVATVVSYNQAVAEYSLTIAQFNKRPQEIVAMLIPQTAPTQTAPTQSAPTQSVASQRPGQTQPPSVSSRPATMIGAGSILDRKNQFGTAPASPTMERRSHMDFNTNPNSKMTSRSGAYNPGQPQTAPSALFPQGSMPTVNRGSNSPPANTPSPATAPPFRITPANKSSIQPPQGDRSADFESNSFGGQPLRPRYSRSANESNSFGK